MPEAGAPGTRTGRGRDRTLEAGPLAPGKKNALRLGAYLVFVDESGFQLTPTIARTWAPRGQTPHLRHWQRHDRISVLSGISVSPERRRFGLYYQWHPHNIREPEVIEFLRDLLRHLRKPVLVIWDRLSVHRGKGVTALCRRVPRLRLEYLPAYAPELNPDEGIWQRTKKRLANACPEDRFDLAFQVIHELEACRRFASQLRSCIDHTGLTL